MTMKRRIPAYPRNPPSNPRSPRCLAQCQGMLPARVYVNDRVRRRVKRRLPAWFAVNPLLVSRCCPCNRSRLCPFKREASRLPEHESGTHTFRPLLNHRLPHERAPLRAFSPRAPRTICPSQVVIRSQAGLRTTTDTRLQLCPARRLVMESHQFRLMARMAATLEDRHCPQCLRHNPCCSNNEVGLIQLLISMASLSSP